MLDRVVDEALGQIKRQRPKPVGEAVAVPEAVEPALEVTFDDHGWVQLVSHRQLLEAIPEGSTIFLDTTAGRYAIADAVAARVWPVPADAERVAADVRKAISIGASRTLQQDETFGVRQLADVALKAMSPGINDPTTAQDALFHMGSILSGLLQLDEVPDAQRDDRGRTLVLSQRTTPEDMVAVAFDEIRLVSADQPTVLIYLLEVIRVVKETLHTEKRAKAVAALDRQADLIAELAEEADAQEPDRQAIRDVHAAKFAKG